MALRPHNPHRYLSWHTKSAGLSLRCLGGSTGEHPPATRSATIPMWVPADPQRASGRAQCIRGLGYLERSSGRSPATGEAQRCRSWTVRSRSVGALKRPHSRQYSGAGKGLKQITHTGANNKYFRQLYPTLRYGAMRYMARSK